MDKKEIVRLGLILAAFCVISAGALAFVYIFTQPQIELYARTSFENSLKEALPGAESYKETEKNVFEGSKGEELVGWVFLQSPQGYGGKIGMLVGVDTEGKVTGVKILSQKETPGLGVNILKESFLSQFKDKTADDPIEPKKDIEAITGATISSRAVSNGVRQSIRSANELIKRF
ncbi:RnfABCDGE type electron transport complex subunit G [Candidatus Saganbacteria bacterium]|nr:RnfABCDGE type electron transport complex subunit G [Candidatus Saganbacteria bacterium]